MGEPLERMDVVSPLGERYVDSNDSEERDEMNPQPQDLVTLGDYVEWYRWWCKTGGPSTQPACQGFVKDMYKAFNVNHTGHFGPWNFWNPEGKISEVWPGKYDHRDLPADLKAIYSPEFGESLIREDEVAQFYKAPVYDFSDIEFEELEEENLGTEEEMIVESPVQNESAPVEQEVCRAKESSCKITKE